MRLAAALGACLLGAAACALDGPTGEPSRPVGIAAPAAAPPVVLDAGDADAHDLDAHDLVDASDANDAGDASDAAQNDA